MNAWIHAAAFSAPFRNLKDSIMVGDDVSVSAVPKKISRGRRANPQNLGGFFLRRVSEVFTGGCKYSRLVAGAAGYYWTLYRHSKFVA